MAQVTFGADVGGDNTVISDDANSSTGLAGGGHRLRFIKALQQLVAVAGFVKTKAVEVAGNATNLAQAVTDANAAKDTTIQARDAALAALQVAAVMEDYGLITEPVTASNDWGTMV
jgi:hypothetical protein